MTRVAVTGLGVISSAGVGSHALWQGLATGSRHSDGRAPAIAGGKQARTMGRIAQLATQAGRLAIEDARVTVDAPASEEIGVFLGSNVDDINLLGLCRVFAEIGHPPSSTAPDLVSFGRLAPERLHAFDYLRSVSNLPAAHLAIASQACGMNCSYVSAGIAGAEAIGEAYLAVRDGLVRLALAGGADCWLTPYAAWRRPLLGGAPAVSEGAGVLLLEPLDAARARRAHMYGEITGYAKTLDAHGFPQSTSGEGLVRCVRAALERAATDAADVDYLGGQGGGGPEADRIESRALDVVFAPGPPPPGGSARRLVGHAGAASGALDAAVTLLAIERQRLPGPDGADEMARRVRVAVNVAFHPLGLSAALVFKRTCERPSPRGAST